VIQVSLLYDKIYQCLGVLIEWRWFALPYYEGSAAWVSGANNGGFYMLTCARHMAYNQWQEAPRAMDEKRANDTKSNRKSLGLVEVSMGASI
jgi:hypothetical protein